MSSGFSKSESVARKRLDKESSAELSDTEPENDHVETAKLQQVDDSKQLCDSLKKLEAILMPLLFTVASFAVRMYKIGRNNRVVWDEAHFGKFGSYYLRHEFYHDVHPPLGKMLVGLSGYLAGYNGSWDFPSGETYPDYIDYTKMRLFNATFSSLCVPLAYYTFKEIGFSIPTTWLFTFMVLFESSYVTLGRFILLDSMLLFFTVSTIYCFARFHNQNRVEGQSFSRKWWKWMLLLGVSIGCALSVKMVGLFVTTLVGIYTIVDLWGKFGAKDISWPRYGAHWLSRIVGLIIVPLLVFLLAFKIHFELLSHTGPGDANMSSLFQANLVGSDVGGGPREIAMGHSSITMKNQGLSGGLLHSHVQTFPEGSHQQQITTYSHKDANNNWIFQRARWQAPFILDGENADGIEYIVDKMHVRIVHPMTGRNLHTHEIAAPVTKSDWEVAGYGNLTIGDEKDNWIVEIMEQSGNEDKLRLHPLTTSFRLKSELLGCYLGVSGTQLPQWGFRQGEVICHKNPFSRDKRTWWNIENHENSHLPAPPADFKLPKTTFLKDFIQLNLAMMATNNALVPDPDKQDDLASAAWQWPTLNVGIRLCSWADDVVKYFLIGSPATTWTSSVAVILFAFLTVYYLIRWQRQCGDFPESKPEKLNLFLMGGIYPMFGWGLHYTPFLIMGRVTYVHHYLPALYFAMVVLCYEVELFTTPLRESTSRNKKIAYYSIYAVSYILVIGTFWFFRHLSFGMDKPSDEYRYLNILDTWRVSNPKP